jgi:MFS family permease
MSGLRYARGDPALLRALVAIGVIGLFGFNWTVVIPLLARFKFDVDSVGFGAMNSSLGIGSLIGAVTVAARTAPSVGTLVAVGATLGVALIALGLAPIYPLALALLVIAGLLGIGFTASTQALLQLSSRPEYRGRVMSMYFFLIAGSTPFGGPFTAALAERFDIAAAIAIEGVLCIAGMAVVWRLRPRG